MRARGYALHKVCPHFLFSRLATSQYRVIVFNPAVCWSIKQMIIVANVLCVYLLLSHEESTKFLFQISK